MCDSGPVSETDVNPGSESAPAADVLGADVAGVDGSADGTAVDDAVARTAELDDLPVAEHVARFDAVHRALTEALSAIDGA